MAVFNFLETKILDVESRVALSVEHQVLCDDTAIIGVCKQEDKATGLL